jgi:hypothetical protein
MHLEQSILIHRKPEEVWAFLGSVSNIAKWDRGVEQTKTTVEAKDTRLASSPTPLPKQVIRKRKRCPIASPKRAKILVG